MIRRCPEEDDVPVELVPDHRRPGGWTLFADGVEQSYVAADDPRHLAFGYVRVIAAVLDAAAPAGAPLRVLHLGGGALTLPRYVAASRPGSVQRAVESDPATVALVARELPWPASVEVVVGDARAAVDVTAGWDVVVADVFQAARSPASVATAGFYAAARRALRPGGLLIANVTDVPPLAYARTQVAGARTAFADVAALGPAAVLRARRAGNVVLVASAAGLPDRLGRAAERVLRGPGLAGFAAGARPLADPPG